jgi:hypothetical protein
MKTESILLILSTALSGVVGAFVTYFLERKRTHKKIEQINKYNNHHIAELVEIIDDVTDILGILNPIINEQSSRKGYINIKDFGLDLETVMPWINHEITRFEKINNIPFDMKALLINPASKYLNQLIDGESDVTSNSITASIAAARHLNRYNLCRVKFELKQYELPVIFHGFMINDEHLFISFTEIIDGKLFGGSKPFIHFKKNREPVSSITQHFFNFFNNWFDYYWNDATSIVKLDK